MRMPETSDHCFIRSLGYQAFPLIRTHSFYLRITRLSCSLGAHFVYCNYLPTVEQINFCALLACVCFLVFAHLSTDTHNSSSYAYSGGENYNSTKYGKKAEKIILRMAKTKPSSSSSCSSHAYVPSMIMHTTYTRTHTHAHTVHSLISKTIPILAASRT